MLGTAWYPEQWPEPRWDDDLRLMQQAGIHMVRVGEFAWSRIEPSEGHHDLEWLDRAITAAAKHGIYTVVGTPTVEAGCDYQFVLPEWSNSFDDINGLTDRVQRAIVSKTERTVSLPSVMSDVTRRWIEILGNTSSITA
jgi:hypothetical protein